MKAYITKYLAITSLLFMISCGKKVSHDQALTYISTIWQNYSCTVDNFNEYSQKLSEAIATTKTNNERKLDEIVVDSLEKNYNTTIIILSSSIQKLKELDEIDTSINLKSNVLNLYQDAKYLLDSCSTQVIKSLSIGLDNVSDQDIEKIREFTSLIIKINFEQNNIDKLATDFQAKYHITDEEIQ